MDELSRKTRKQANREALARRSAAYALVRRLGFELGYVSSVNDAAGISAFLDAVDSGSVVITVTKRH